jgi:hypothetical protein
LCIQCDNIFSCQIRYDTISRSKCHDSLARVQKSCLPCRAYFIEKSKINAKERTELLHKHCKCNCQRTDEGHDTQGGRVAGSLWGVGVSGDDRTIARSVADAADIGNE